MLEVVDAKYIDGYKIHVRFNNGEEGVVDLTESLWGPVFEPLKDPVGFQRFEVSKLYHTITWENGADLAPEYIYEKMIEQARAAPLENKPR
jgi:hypothetical protein